MFLLQSFSTVSLSLCHESWWTQLNPQLQLSLRNCGGHLLLAFPQDPCHLLLHHLVLYNVLWRQTSSSSVGEHLGRPCRHCMRAHTRVGHTFFSKKSNVLACFYVLYKRMRHFLHSFMFFIKERDILCVLLHSL